MFDVLQITIGVNAMEKVMSFLDFLVDKGLVGAGAFLLVAVIASHFLSARKNAVNPKGVRTDWSVKEIILVVISLNP